MTEEPENGVRGRPGWAQVAAAAVVAGVASSLVTLAVTGWPREPTAPPEQPVRTASPAAAEEDDDEGDEDRGGASPAPAPPPSPTPGPRPQPLVTGVGDVAAAVLPSVAKVDVVRAEGAGSGSAVVHREDGLLVTNAHVVAGATGVTVTLADGTQLPAEVVGADPPSDIALLRIARTDLPVPRIAPEPARVGDPAIAIGSPFGLASTVTAGIVSATERVVQTPQAPLVGVLQTDAAINPGNSGGPLVNGRGELIGVTTAILTDTGQTAGVGFAVPAVTVVEVADRLAAGLPVTYAQLGVQTAPVTAAVAEELGLPAARGARITEVVPGGAAERAGMRVDDVVVGFAREDVGDVDDLAVSIRRVEPGAIAAIAVLRDGGKPVTLIITLG